MKRRYAAASDSSNNWLLAQWVEAVHTLQSRPPSRRGQMLISDAALENCLEIVSSDSKILTLEGPKQALIEAA